MQLQFFAQRVQGIWRGLTETPLASDASDSANVQDTEEEVILP